MGTEDTSGNVAPEGAEGNAGKDFSAKELAEQLLAKAKKEGVDLVGPDGLLTGLTKNVLETALKAELTEHLGYEAHDRRRADNARNGTSEKTVHTDIGPVSVEVPRDRAGTFDPKIVPKHKRRIGGFDEAVLSLYAKGLSTGEIQAHLSETYGAGVSRDTISKITDAVNQEVVAWQNRPLDPCYPVVYIDAIVVKIRDQAVANRPIYVVMGISLDGERDVLGLWVGTGGEGAKQWLAILTELKNRGVGDVLICCCDGLRGLPEAIDAVWPQADVQTCVVHLVRATLRYASQAHWQKITTDLRKVYTAPTVDSAAQAFEDFDETWGKRYPAIIRLWQDSWEEFIPFLAFPPEIRKVIYTTNAIESLNARFRRATRIRGHFPSEQAAIKVLYLTITQRPDRGVSIVGRVANWKAALNTFSMHYGDRVSL
jgi:transposase-like protein